ncbi:hypothetical protein RFI_13566 [Reticulomyxa filosa]|uniref:ShKT domain-containing protein n=1 Tax=Reticulomyxa filosa TaxID=46433 RepID=X6NCI9_RETFI|nr:hypothetical protein RFI_13566 [Reticulomyxa filosa]|eukprot:ETO23613.1 hypothetical protein RFI_13566 [Reticulomyxa filosa]
MLLRCVKVVLFYLVISTSYGTHCTEGDKDSCPSVDTKSLSALEYMAYLKTHDTQQEWTDKLLADAKNAKGNANCEDRHEPCAELVRMGECEKNPAWMIFNCGKSCRYCHLQDQNIRCQRNPIQLPSLQHGPGSITKIIQRAIQENPQYKPNVSLCGKRDNLFFFQKKKEGKFSKFFFFFLPPPPFFFFKKKRRYFARSQDAGDMKDDGSGQFESIVSEARTSSTYWCLDSCWNDPLVQQLISKAENITTIPRENSEYIQVLKYEPGQYYVRHHDFIEGHLELPIGPRVPLFYYKHIYKKKKGKKKFIVR